MAIVYIHRRKTTGKLFYVGIGDREKRAYDTNGRNPYWKNIYNKHGRTVEILEEGITREQACELEVFLIALIGKSNLANLTDGGEGKAGYTYNRTERHSEMASKIITKAWERGCYDTAAVIEGHKKNAIRQRGAGNHQSKLTEEDVLEVRRLYATGSYTHKELGDKFGIQRRSIGDIILRRNWKHI